MSWLFCCGSSEAQRKKELQQTLDLSAKPISNSDQLSKQSQKGIEDLSGGLNVQDEKLKELLEFKQSSQVSQTSRKEEKSQQRMIHDKRLNNYLSQAQKLISQKGSINNSKRKVSELNLKDHSQELVDDEYLQFNPIQIEFDPQESKIASMQTQQTQFFLSNINDLELVIEESLQQKKNSQFNTQQQQQQQSPQFANKSRKTSGQQTQKQKNTGTAHSNLPKSTKNETKKNFQINQLTHENSKVEETLTKSQNMNKTTVVKKQQTFKKNTDQKQNISNNVSKQISKGTLLNQNSTLEIDVNFSLEGSKQSKESPPFHRSSKDVLNGEYQEKFNEKFSQKGVNENSRKMSTSNADGYDGDQEQIFPSNKSAFSFQPKYFKPNTTKAADKAGKIELSGGNIQNETKFNELGVKNSTLSRMKLGGEDLCTPTYSGSSTIVSNSRNPSIVTKDGKSATIFLTNKSIKKTN